MAELTREEVEMMVKCGESLPGVDLSGLDLALATREEANLTGAYLTLQTKLGNCGRHSGDLAEIRWRPHPPVHRTKGQATEESAEFAHLCTPSLRQGAGRAHHIWKAILAV
jgi:hypothetical protein